MNSIDMTVTRPYLIRAIYEWIVDNGCTPYLVINAEYPDVAVPVQYVEEGKIILNISPTAVQGLRLANDRIEFKARFSGIPTHVFVPVLSVVAIYARENGRGMVFNDEEEGTLPPSTSSNDNSGGKGSNKNKSKDGGSEGKKSHPHLKVIK